jgi:dUTP pyrophosphatase
MRLEWYKFDERATIPTIPAYDESACFDLKGIEDVTIPKNLGSAFVRCGLGCNIPKEFYLRLNDRSGNGIKKNLKIHQGIIDSGYTGEITIKVWNLGNEDITLKAGDGICQVELLKRNRTSHFEITKEEWDEYCASSKRGTNGFGSTDQKEVKNG